MSIHIVDIYNCIGEISPRRLGHLFLAFGRHSSLPYALAIVSVVYIVTVLQIISQHPIPLFLSDSSEFRSDNEFVGGVIGVQVPMVLQSSMVAWVVRSPFRQVLLSSAVVRPPFRTMGCHVAKAHCCVIPPSIVC